MQSIGRRDEDSSIARTSRRTSADGVVVGEKVRRGDLLDALRPKIEDAVAEPLDAFPDLLAVDTVAQIVDAVWAMFFDTTDATNVVLETLLGYPDGWW